MMLRHLKELDAADRIEAAVADVIKEGKTLTKDLNAINPVGTMEMTDAIIAHLK
jgi:isocitrate dehydrogenase (NAD+)